MLVVEVLANKIKCNSQYADDTTILLENSKYIKPALTVKTEFGKAAGLNLNLNKTEALTFTHVISNADITNIQWMVNSVKCMHGIIRWKGQETV